ncbi:MAG TPA: helix-turn-helix transcriptional regulator [Pirellulales bacterium]|jgi:transcriptional regulator with XRE-family HTH domain|nr:helix-turn-helix transcriptional regulator [Pirellulales bacterium]
MVTRPQELKGRGIFAANVRRLRQEKGLSQDGLAHLSGVHRTYIGAIERCEKNVSIDSMEKIALALQCSLQSLLGEFE